MFSCNQNHPNENLPHFSPEFIPAKGRLVHPDSIIPPQTKALGSVFIGPNCTPLEVPANTNVQALGRPENRPANLP
nr:hypothetical protein [Haliscomenobacter sp.]